MRNSLSWAAFTREQRAACLAVFDANCPEFFAPNERADYEAFLDDEPTGYEVCLVEGAVVGAFGLFDAGPGRGRLNWILLDPRRKGLGIGTAAMERVQGQARERGIAVIEIAASHKSAGFFARFGAVEVRTTSDGWGPGMHRVDMELWLGSA